MAKLASRVRTNQPPSAAGPAQVDAWIAASATFAQPILLHLRKQVHAAVPDAEEQIKWSRPFFLVNGSLLCYMAAFKQHCGFGFWSPEMTALLEADGISEPGAAGSFGRISAMQDLPAADRLQHYLRYAAARARTGEAATPMASRRRSSAKAAIPVPAELTEALADAPSAAAAFHQLPPSCRREYLEWITSAKRPETLTRRIGSAVVRLSEGKRLHD